jgi:hypothetical protein
MKWQDMEYMVKWKKLKRSIFMAFFSHSLLSVKVIREIKTRAQIETLESIMKHLCTCELTAEGRAVVNNVIEGLKKKL